MEELNKFRKFLNEDKFKVGDIVTMTGGGSPMKITGNCSLGGMKMATYSVKKSDGKEVEYDESELTLAESILNESTEDGSQYHIDQIDDDLMNGDFGTAEDIDGYLDNIIAGIEELRISYKGDMDGDSFDPDREYNDEFSSGGNGAGFDHSPHDL
tara:strand:+ start:324 stop:788 length:465 start_codon:yes stop_codon:yes gene_type:complete